MAKHERKRTREEVARDNDYRNKWRVRSALIYAVAGVSWTVAGMQHNEALASLMKQDFSRDDTGCGTRLETSGALESVKQKIAHECIESKTGRVALVWYGVSDTYVHQLAEDAELAVPYSFDSMLMPQVVPVTIAKEVEEQFLSANPDGCFDKMDSSKYLSKIADVTMNLSAFDEVIGISPFHACDKDGDIAGVNHSDDAGRYTMIVDNSSDDGMRGDYNSRVFAHEYGHAKGLQHASRVGDGTIHINPFNVKEQKVDLEYILRAKDATEYGDSSNIMGCGEYEINAPQIRELLVPEILLGEILDPRSDITRQGVVYERHTFHDIKPFASIKLERPIEIEMYNSDEQNKRELSKVKYDEVAIEPYFSMGDSNTAGAAIYLVNSANMQTLAFGYIYENYNKMQQMYEVNAGNRKVLVTIGHDSIEVKDVS